MKKTASIIASVLLIAILASALAVNVFAASTEHTEFSTNVYLDSYTHIYPVISKYNNSDLMIDIQTGTNSYYYVRAVGCDYLGRNLTNYTFYNNQIIDHVTVQRGTMYSIPSVVDDRGDGWATIGIKAPGNPGAASGYWSPDTYVQYATPTFPPTE